MAFLRGLAPLSPSALRALPYIQSGRARGLSSTALQRSLSAAGIGVRRTDLLSAIRYVEGTAASAERLKYVRKDRRPDPARLADARTRTLRAFSFVARVDGRDINSGQLTRRYVTVASDRAMTITEIEDMAARFGTEPTDSGSLEDVSVTITSAVKSGRLGTFL